MKWAFFIVLGLYTYEKFRPIETPAPVEVVRIVEKACPVQVCPEIPECTATIVRENVIVTSQDEPCRCGDFE